jgi:Skp family chaperone for outer membrane proteins
MNIKSLFLFFFLSFFLLNISSIKAEEKIAFIDLNIIFDNSKAGKEIIKQVQKTQKNNSNDFNNLKKKIEKDRNDLKKQKNVLSEDEYKKKFVELDKSFKEYNALLNKRNSEITNFQLKARAEFYNKLTPILETYAKENSISIILKKENILIGKTDLDISKKILELFDKNVKKISVK